MSTSSVGRSSRERGLSLETRLIRAHERYATEGRAWVRQVGPPVVVIGGTARDGRGRTGFRGAFAGTATVDFIGVGPGGRAVLIEAKATQEQRIRCSVIAAHQRADLDAAHGVGAMCLVVVEVYASPLPSVYVVPWSRWPARGSMGADELGTLGHEVCAVRLDWLDALGMGRVHHVAH